jgi:hypothetical protein
LEPGKNDVCDKCGDSCCRVWHIGGRRLCESCKTLVTAFAQDEPRGHTVKGADGATTTNRLMQDLAAVRASTGISIKDGNPKDGVGIRKVPFHLVPAQVIGEIALGMAEGDLKYGSYNFRAIGVRASVYYSAAERHLKAFWEGEDIDPESRLSHITKALSTLTVLRDAMLNDKWEDDRPPAVSNPNWLSELNTKMGELLDRVPRKQQGWTARNLIKRLAARATGTEGTK